MSIENEIYSIMRDNPKSEFQIRLCYVLSHGAKYNISKNVFQMIINAVHHSDTFKMEFNKQMGCYYSDDMIYMYNNNGNTESVNKKIVTFYSDWAKNEILPTNLQINFKSPLGVRLILNNISKIEHHSFPMTSQLHHTEVRSVSRYLTCIDRINEIYYIDFIRTRDMLDNTESLGINIGINKNKNTYMLKKEHHIHLANIIQNILEITGDNMVLLKNIRTHKII